MLHQITSSNTDETVTCRVGNVEVVFVIDSGSPINTITAEDWSRLKALNADVEVESKQSGRVFQAYASRTPLEVLCTFRAKITVNKEKPVDIAEFLVIANARKALLSRQTSEKLKLLKVGLSVNGIKEKHHPFASFPKVMVTLEIDPEVKPKQSPYFRIPAPIMEDVLSELQKLQDLDIIEVASNPCNWISPLIVVPKSGGSFRLCVDMREANKAIKRVPFPVPTIESCLNQLRNATKFSKIDLEKAYHHVMLSEESRDITTFMTPLGAMRYKRLMFGVKPAVEVFQKVMTEMLAGCEGTIIYLDDIAVAGSEQNHDERLEKVLKVLKANNASLNSQKCKFGVSELDILGFTVDSKGIKPSKEKVQAIKNFREPRSIEEVRSFLGLVQYVGHFIRDLASKTEPLRKLIRKEVEKFGTEQKEAFDALRLELVENVVQLGFYDPKDETELFVDASPWGLGATLVQKRDNEPRIISFASKSLTDAERVYPQTQREALAVPWAMERFNYYLFGLHFTLITDHKTLEFIFKGKHQTGKRACTRAESWALRVQPYDFDVKHVPGKENIADSLSRLCQQEDGAFDEGSEHFLCAIGTDSSEMRAISLTELAEETATDEALQKVVKALNDNIWQKEDPTL